MQSSEPNRPGEGESSRVAAASARVNKPLLVGGTLPQSAKAALSPQQAQHMLQHLRVLCLDQNGDARALEETADTLFASGYTHESTRVLAEALASPEVHPQAGAIWMRRIVSRRSWNRRYPERMDELCSRGEVGYRAVFEFLEAAGAKRKAPLIRRALRKHRQWLRTHPVGWGVAARALMNARDYRMLARWMSGRRNRGELDLGLLHALAWGMRGSGREREAREIVVSALAKPGADQQFPVLKLWHAMEEALGGNTQSAATAFNDLIPSGWDDDLLCRYYLVRGVIRVQQAPRGERAEAFARANDRLRQRFHKVRVYRREILLRREYRRCVWRMARDSGAWRGLLAPWRSADSPLLLLPLLLVPGLQLLLPLYLLRLCRYRAGLASAFA